MQMRWRYAPLVALAALGLWPAAASATWAGKPGKVVYSNLDGIHTVDRHGKHLHLLTKDTAPYGLDVSADGREIVYSNGGVWRMRIDGSHRQMVFDARGT